MEKNTTAFIDINQVAKIFNLSIEAIRKYKQLGLIESCKRDGKKDLYDPNDIFRKRDLIKSHKQDGKSLKEIQNKFIALKEQKSLEEKLEDTGAKKILIIEDEKSLISILKEFLIAGFPGEDLKIFDANDGSIGIELAISIKPDLIILDIAIPTISGIEVHKKLARHPNTRHSKFIFLSAQVKHEPKNTRFLPKPVSMKVFLESVQSIGLGTEAPTHIMENLLE